MARQRIARGATIALYDIEEAGRHAGLNGQLGQPQRGVGRQLRWLEHDRVAGGQRGAHLPRHHDQREVPRRDGADHAVGLGHHHPQMIVARRCDLATELVRVLGEKAQALGRERDVPGRDVAHRTRGAHGFERTEPRRIGLDQIGPAAQHACAFARRAACPVAVAPCAPGVAHGGVDRGGVGQRKLGVCLSIGGPVHGHAAGVGDEASTDEMARGHLDLLGVEHLHGGRVAGDAGNGDRS